jgi:PAS domain S-box-containing protein
MPSANRRDSAVARIVEQSANEVYIFDGTTLRLRYSNKRARANLGYPAKERSQLSLGKVAPELGSEAMGTVLEQLKVKRTARLETRFRRRDGTVYPVEALLELCTFRKEPAVVVLAVDLTLQKHAKALVRESQERFWQLLEFAPDATLLVDKDGTILYANRLAAQLLGWPPGELLGQSVDLLVPPVWRERHTQHRRRYGAAPEHRPMGRGLQLYALRRDGTQFPVDVSLGPIETADGLMVAVALRDITAVKRLEQEVAHQQRLQAIGRLAAGVAHDFNNLLAIVLAASECLAASIAPDHPMRADVDAIQDAAQRGGALVRQLLTFARRQPPEVRTVQADSLVESITAILTKLCNPSISLSLDLNAPDCSITVDPVQFEQIVINLVVNAVDAMPAGGMLALESSEVELDASVAARFAPMPPGRYFRLAVRDTGCGMTADVLARAFEPFFTTKRTGQGTGLGLATAYALVKQNGGFIWLASEPGRGTEATLYFPVVSSPQMSAHV